jgi:hypothetical protein
MCIHVGCESAKQINSCKECLTQQHSQMWKKKLFIHGHGVIKPLLNLSCHFNTLMKNQSWFDSPYPRDIKVWKSLLNHVSRIC